MLYAGVTYVAFKNYKTVCQKYFDNFTGLTFSFLRNFPVKTRLRKIAEPIEKCV